MPAVKITDGKPKRVGDGTPGPGRPKGSQNKATREAKEVIAEAASRLGGVERLIKWAQEDAQNERIFWGSMFPKLLPLQVNSNVEVVDRTEQLQRARDEIRGIFGERPAIRADANGRGLPH